MSPPLPPLDPGQARRYARQLSLPGIGPGGQARLLRSTVVVVGVGGLGCPAALYLAAAGVGRLRLVDGDRVDASNLHRQVLFATGDVGRPKVEVAAERLRALNPDCTVETVAERLVASNARAILSGADVVLDGTDNFPTRFLVNDACVLLGLPNAHGSVFRFEGQASLFLPGKGPCYRCLHPEPPPPGLVPSCAEAGVLGILPGVVGGLQATETLKHLLGIGEGLSGRLLVYDALAMTFRELRLKRDPGCPSCGEKPTIHDLADLEGYGCASDLPPILAAPDVAARLAAADPPVLVDVREDWEYEMGALPGALHIPLGTLPERWRELPADRPVVVYCHAGLRSFEAMQYLRARGLGRVASLEGGTNAWSHLVDPSLPLY